MPLAIVLGSEGKGVRRLVRDKCDITLSIPMLGRVNSLNVSVAAGVVLFEAVRQRRGPAKGAEEGLRKITLP
jgi:23S rRNA (guanosine2251-2'-O)-methyltransferase